MKLLGREDWKSVLQRKSGLRAENRIGAGASAVSFEFTLIQDQAQEIKILNHNAVTMMGWSEWKGETFSCFDSRAQRLDRAKLFLGFLILKFCHAHLFRGVVKKGSDHFFQIVLLLLKVPGEEGHR